VDQETVRAVVEAYAKGRIDLVEPPAKTSQAFLRNAPSFLASRDGRDSAPDHPYTATTVAAFLGWEITKVKNAIQALGLIEEGVLKEKHFDGLGPQQAHRVVVEANKARKAE
jgi:hypothetical protein